MYEYPYTLLRLFKNVTKDILEERIYVSQLYTPILPCYTEIGYGVGNFIGDAGIFVSFVKGKYESIGAKFTIELGKWKIFPHDFFIQKIYCKFVFW